MVPEVVVAQMNGLSSLPRVAAVAMFASRQDMDKLRSVTIYLLWLRVSIYRVSPSPVSIHVYIRMQVRGGGA